MNEHEYEIIRQIKGRGFTYKYTRSQKTIHDQKIREWIDSLAIPPAWKQVTINPNRNGKVLATGRDAKNRKQYIYNPSWRAKKEKEKYDRILKFAEKLPLMRKETADHLKLEPTEKNAVLACMVRLLDNAYFRAGSQKYQKENGTYGLTTLRSKHLTIKGHQLEFEYQGKSGKEQHKEVESKILAEVISSLDELPGYRIFKYIDSHGKKHYVDRTMLNEYIQEIMGDDFTAKDFRTWAGTYLAAVLLDEMGISQTEKETQSNILRAVDKVAETLGNTREIARASYIDPRILEQYSEGKTIRQYIIEVQKELSHDELSGATEKAVYKLLKAI